jgi:type VI protein secretion system component Hcp
MTFTSTGRTGLKPGQASLSTGDSAQIPSIPILGLKLAVLAPRDPSASQPAGRRRWKPIVITKEWGASSSKLFGFMTSQTVLPKVHIKFGGSDQWITLLDAQIAGIDRGSINGKLQERLTFSYRKIALGKTGSGRELTNSYELERLALTFQKITVENADSKATSKDDWLSP